MLKLSAFVILVMSAVGYGACNQGLVAAKAREVQRQAAVFEQVIYRLPYYSSITYETTRLRRETDQLAYTASSFAVCQTLLSAFRRGADPAFQAIHRAHHNAQNEYPHAGVAASFNQLYRLHYELTESVWGDFIEGW